MSRIDLRDRNADSQLLPSGSGPQIRLRHPVSARFDSASISGTNGAGRNVFFFTIGDDADGKYNPQAGAPASIQFPNFVSWTDRTELDIQYYSGQATYTQTINVPVAFLGGGEPVLDLGDVRDLVDVKVNEKLVGTLWKPPYRISLKGVLDPGENELEITVANTWINRFIGDLIRHGRWGVNLGNAPRYTQAGAATQDYNETTPILKSGLLGPVTVEVME